MFRVDNTRRKTNAPTARSSCANRSGTSSFVSTALFHTSPDISGITSSDISSVWESIEIKKYGERALICFYIPVSPGRKTTLMEMSYGTFHIFLSRPVCLKL